VQFKAELLAAENEGWQLAVAAPDWKGHRVRI